MRKRPLTYTLGILTMAMMVSLTGCNDDGTTTESTEVIEVTEETSDNSKTTETSGKKSTTEESKSNEDTDEQKATGSTEGKTSDTQNNTQSNKTSTTQPNKTTEAPSTEASKSTEAPKSECSHDWTPIYKTVHHDAVTHVEKVEVPGAMAPIQEDHDICNGCQYDLTANHVGLGDNCPNCGSGSFHNQLVTVRYEQLYDLVDQTVVDQEAYDEQVLDHYECTKCGATK